MKIINVVSLGVLFFGIAIKAGEVQDNLDVPYEILYKSIFIKILSASDTCQEASQTIRTWRSVCKPMNALITSDKEKLIKLVKKSLFYKKNKIDSSTAATDFLFNLAGSNTRYENNFEILEWLQEKNVDFNCKKERFVFEDGTISFGTPLFLAINFKKDDRNIDDVSFIEDLLKLGANPNITISYGDNHLAYARNLDTVKLLLRYGANPLQTNNKGITFVDSYQEWQKPGGESYTKEEFIGLLTISTQTFKRKRE